MINTPLLFIDRWWRRESLTSTRGRCGRGWTGDLITFINDEDDYDWCIWAGLFRAATALCSTTPPTPSTTPGSSTSGTTGSSPTLSESQFFISMKYVKNRKVEIEYTSNSYITSWQSQSLRNRSPNKVEVSSWDLERPGFRIKRPGTSKKRFHQTNPPPLDGTPQCGSTLSLGAHKVDLHLG